MKVVRDILLEAKADNDKLIAYVGEDEANRFFKMKDRLKGSEKDLYYWLKKEPQELTDRLDELENEKTRSQVNKEAKKGAELVAENDYYKVYKINTFEAAKKYGANTKWCITGKESGWIKDENENKYWKRYTEEGIEFYFFISKKDNHKYALASHPKNRDNYQIFDETDVEVDDIPEGVEIEGVYKPTLFINGLYIKGNNVLIGCDEDVKNAEIPDGVTRIGNNAFYNCTSLTNVTIPNSMTSIGASAFYNCSGLTSIIIPDGVTTIGDNAFSDCTGLKSITIGNKVTSIEDGTFFCCSSLTSITIPNSVTGIGYSAFYGCKSLTSITIPGSVTSIRELVFDNCTGLTSITFTDTKAQWNAISKGYHWNYKTGNYTIHCTDGDIKKEANESLTESVLTEIYPNKGESKKDFISRFMSATKDEYPDEKQRLAVAYSYWDRKDKKEEDMKVIKEDTQEITQEDTERGLTSVLSDLIQQQWSIIDAYNGAIATFDFEGYGEEAEILKDLVADETANIGMLEGIMERIEPLLSIDKGREKIDQ